MESGIYEILNTKNHKRYIGSAKNIHKRLLEHKARLKINKHKNAHLQNAWNKYGEGIFEFSKIASCGKSELLNKEQEIFNLYIKSGKWDSVYNM
jgi:group I intron endonuclease